MVGSSLGGNAVLELALNHSDLTAGLILVDAPQHYFVDGLSPAQFADWVGRLATDRSHTITAMVPTWFRPGFPVAEQASTLRMVQRSGVHINDTLRSAAVHDRRGELASLTVPVAFVHGEMDSEVPITVAWDAAAQVPSSEVVVLSGAGHMPHLDSTPAFTATLDRLLDTWIPPEGKA